MNQIQSQYKTHNLIIYYGLVYGIQFLITIILLILSIYYRKTPIIVFDSKQFNFIPLTNILCYPNDLCGSISTPIWIFICSLTFRSFANNSIR